MNIILHSAHWEPITVIDLPIEKLQKAQELGGIKLKLEGTDKECRVLCFKLGEPYNMFLYVTPDEVEALMLKASYLPGQHTQKRKFTK